MSEEAQKTEEELLSEWENMADDAEGESSEGKETVNPERLLDQNEIDSLLGVGDDEDGSSSGIRALLDQNVVNYEKLPMLEVIYDKFERFLSTSLRYFTADNVDVAITNMTSVRFGDYLNSVPLPAGLVVVNAVGLDDYVLLVYENQLVYSVVDVLLGGRKVRFQSNRVEVRNFTTIERRIMDNLTDVVLNDLSEAFAPVAPVQFKAERMEMNPRFALISQETNVSILVSVRVSLEGREGMMHFCLPYATLEPIREQLLQQFMGEKFGQDNIWENHLSQELYHTHVSIKAIMDEMPFSLSEVLKWKVGDTISFDASTDTPIYLDCGGGIRMIGQMGRAKDYKAVKITHTITDVDAQKDKMA